MMTFAPSVINSRTPICKVEKSDIRNYEVLLMFENDGYSLFHVDMTKEEARELANKILAMCESEPITPIGDFQDSTPNNQ